MRRLSGLIASVVVGICGGFAQGQECDTPSVLDVRAIGIGAQFVGLEDGAFVYDLRPIVQVAASCDFIQAEMPLDYALLIDGKLVALSENKHSMSLKDECFSIAGFCVLEEECEYEIKHGNVTVSQKGECCDTDQSCTCVADFNDAMWPLVAGLTGADQVIEMVVDPNFKLPDIDPENNTVGLLAADLPCPGDCNLDGELNILDFLCFQELFVQQDLQADCNLDGALNILDFTCYQGLFAAGCL